MSSSSDRSAKLEVAARSTYVPALDGLRAFAVAAVVATHFDLPYSVGGRVGVDIFFVLSGFLITSLISSEQSKLGRISWRRFYVRRGLRLLPALWLSSFLTLLLVVMTRSSISSEGLISIGKDPDPNIIGNTFREVGVAVLYLGNLPQILGARDVFFGHTWSLAVEEQFYLLMAPLWIASVRTFRAGDRWIPFLALTLITATLRTGGIFGPGGLLGYRFDALFLGCTLSLMLHDPRIASKLKSLSRLLTLPSLLILAGVIGLADFSDVSSGGRAVYLVAAVGAGLLVVSIWQGSAGRIGEALSVAPLVYIGQISYGIYLYHLPIGRRIAIADLSWPSPAIVALKGGLTLLVAVLSFEFVEKRFLRLKDRFRV